MVTPCPEHGRLCAFRGDEPDRCPWCHCLWTHIITTDYHSCEAVAVWSGRDRAERRTRSARMRREATARVDRGANRAGPDQ